MLDSINFSGIPALTSVSADDPFQDGDFLFGFDGNQVGADLAAVLARLVPRCVEVGELVARVPTLHRVEAFRTLYDVIYPPIYFP